VIVGTIGSFCVRALVGVCAGALFCHIAYAVRRSRRAEISSRAAMLAMFAVTAGAAACLWSLLIQEDWSYAYVAEYTAQGLPVIYRIAALWAGNAGSLLFWSFLLALYGTVIAWTASRNTPDSLQPVVRAVLTLVTGFYTVVLNVAADPFQRLPHPAIAGNGLNPLLQNPGMTIHPVNLYLGNVGLTVPFAYAVAALLQGRVDREWIMRARRWTLASWLFLSIGILYGMRWSYEELGWGGYWAWDPVENASLLPWLGATAFLHSALVQERRGSFKRWNVVLVSVTFLLTLLATYLTRSGALWSIHAFASGPLGTWFLGFLAGCSVAVAGLLVWRWPRLRPPSRVTPGAPQDAVFTLNNLLLLAAAAAILWGTLLPLVSQLTLGHPRMVTERFYNFVCLSIGVVIVWLMGIGPLLDWRRRRHATPSWLLLAPTVAGIVAGGGVTLWLRSTYGAGTWLGGLGIAAAISVIGGAVLDMRKRMRPLMRRQGWPKALLFIVVLQRRRTGAWLVHLAVAVIALGVAGSGAFHADVQSVLAPGQSVRVGAYDIRYTGLGAEEAPEGRLLYANLIVEQNAAVKGALRPAVLFYDDGEAPTTQVALYETAASDLYAVLLGTGSDGSAVLGLHVNPLTVWIWRGGELLIAGALLSLWPSQSARRFARRVSGVRMPGGLPLERGANP
jgi:cytochrome c-type biogenesis protein CcmF